MTPQELGNQPAYPKPGVATASGNIVAGQDGMSNREAFAMAAMQGFIAADEDWGPAFTKGETLEQIEAGRQRYARNTAEASLRYTDALLAALAAEVQP